ncbi:MAG: D-alanyl-D-alanine carboxypeptidase [Clostridia bacterium]|nr:D-alanyl-D-alanine carboxypeptidase [Clostridia bacterium]
MKTKTAFAVLLIVLTACFPLPVYAERSVSVSAESAVLITPDGGIIYEKNARKRRGMASTTKIMTALVAIENLSLDDIIAFPAEARSEGSSAYFEEGENVTVRDLLYALMLRSANDAAECLAIAAAGSIGGFADMMNERAEKIGLSDTHFVNPHGLDAEGHYSTALDMARLTAEALKNDAFREIVSTKGYVCRSLSGGYDRTFRNHNRLLGRDGIFGVKTGYTSACGRCLVTACERGGKTLIAVTLSAPDDWNDHLELYDHGFGRKDEDTEISVGVR